MASFLYLVLRYSKLSSWLRHEHGIAEGSVEYVDTQKETPSILVSKKHGLRGRPVEYERGVIWFAAVAMILALNAIVMNFTQNIEDWA